MSRDPAATAMTRRGLAVMFWATLVAVASSLLVEWRGLRYVQGVVWPSDLYAFEQVEQGPIDVAILGSSRAAFGLSPSTLDRCLEGQLGRPTHSVNLGRAFTTAYAADLLARDLLQGERRPSVLVLAIEPEMFDEHNPRMAVSVSTLAGVAQIPGALGTVNDLGTFFGALHPLVRGPETLALYLSGRWDTKPWLRWLMLHHGGGLFCSGDDACRVHNEALEQTLDGWDELVARMLLPKLKEDRFPDYQVGTGPVHAHAEALLGWAEAEGIQVVLVELPRLRGFERHIPAEVKPAYQAYLEGLLARHPLPHHTVGHSDWTQKRRYYVDGEHFNADGSARYTKELCRQTLAPLLREQASHSRGN
jgi:hypothetical protein